LKVLFTQLGRIGDMILATPIFEALKNKYPDVKIHVLASSHNHLILKNNPNINKVLVYDKKPLNTFSLIIKLVNGKYDYLIDPKDHFSSESKYIAKLVNAEKKIGFNSKKDKVFDIAVKPHNKGIHYTTICFQALKELGIEPPEVVACPKLYLNRKSEFYVNEFIEHNNLDDYILINISASHQSKMWAIENWIDVARYLINKKQKIVLSFAPTESDEAKELFKKVPELIVFTSRNLDDVLSIINRCKLTITVDTSVVHISAAFDKPVLVLIKSIADTLNKFAPLNTIKELVITSENLNSIKSEELIVAYEKLSDKIS